MPCQDCGRGTDGKLCLDCLNEDMSTKMNGVQEFVCEQMAECVRRIKELEQDNIALRGEVSRVLEDAKRMPNPDLGDWSVEGSELPPSTSTPKEKMSKLELTIPTSYEDIEDLELRDNLEAYGTLVSGLKMSISKVQDAYIMFWVDSQSRKITGKPSQVTDLLSDGIKNGIWPKGWAPNGIKDWPLYLQDRVKKYLCRKRKDEEKEKLKQQMDSLLAAKE